MLITAKTLVERELVEQQWANFIIAWSSSIIREAGDRFHCNFNVVMQVDPSRYRGVNLGLTTFAQKQA